MLKSEREEGTPHRYVPIVETQLMLCQLQALLQYGFSLPLRRSSRGILTCQALQELSHI